MDGTGMPLVSRCRHLCQIRLWWRLHARDVVRGNASDWRATGAATMLLSTQMTRCNAPWCEIAKRIFPCKVSRQYLLITCLVCMYSSTRRLFFSVNSMTSESNGRYAVRLRPAALLALLRMYHCVFILQRRATSRNEVCDVRVT
jgi:hypothetical protein